VHNTFGTEQRESAATDHTTHNHPKLDCGDPVETGGFPQADSITEVVKSSVLLDAEAFGRAGS
jgi:hypothetical protein